MCSAAVVAVLLLALTATSAFAAPAVTSDQPDYAPGSQVTLIGSGWLAADNPVHIAVVAEGGVWSYEADVLLDGAGGFTHAFSLPDWFVTPYYVTATGQASGSVDYTFTDAATSTKFTQLKQKDGLNPDWVNGNLNGTQTSYVEGMSVPQRLVLDGIASAGTHYVTFDYGFTKGGKYAYDFLTSWDQAVTAADTIGGMTWLDSWKWLGYNSADFPTHATATIPSSPFASSHEAAYESWFGPRTIDVYGNGTLGTVTVAIDPTLDGTTTSDSAVRWTVTWSGTSTKVMILYAGHVAVGIDDVDHTGIGWGAGTGAGAISGAPYHHGIVSSDVSGGSRDNQLMASAILQKSRVTGTKFHDFNGNGVRDTGDVGLAGWEIWIDIDGDGVKTSADPSTFTGQDGSYSLDFYIAGKDTGGTTTYTIREVLQSGWRQTYPAATGYHSIAIAPGDLKSGYDFGNQAIVYSLSLVKTGAWSDTSQDGYADPGEPIYYTFAVTNTGNTALTNVTVTDTVGGVAVSGGPLLSLAAGATDYTTFTGVYYITQDDIDKGDFYNLATAESNESDPAEDDEDVLLRGTGPSLALINIVKTTNGDDGLFIPVGAPVTWRYEVTNIGHVTLTDVTVEDSDAGVTPAYVSGDTDGDGALDLTETWIYEATGTAIKGAYSNIGKATGTGGGETVTAEDPSSYFGAEPAIDLVKSGTFNDENKDGYADAGETISYAFTVTNTGNVVLYGVALEDTIGGVTISGGPIAELAVGAEDSTTFTGTYTVTQTDIDDGHFYNLATVTAKDAIDTPTSAEDDEDVTLNQNPGIEATKNGAWVDGDGDGWADAGETVNYTFSVTNTGNVTLHDVTVTDPKITVVGGPITLDPGETDTSTFTGSYVLTQDDVDAGNVHNVALATGYPPSGPPVTDDPPADTSLPQNPALSIVKTGAWVDGDGDGYADPGEAINYAFAVTNEGNVTLHNVTVADTIGGVAVSGGPTTLDVGETDSSTFTGIYYLTQTDIDAGHFYNLATADSDESDPAEDDEDVMLATSSTIELVKSGAWADGDADGAADPGELINYSFTVTNTGHVTLTNVLVTDPKITVVGGPIWLAPGQVDTLTFTGSYAITQADIDAGLVDNTALVTGTPPSGPDVTNTDDETVELPQAPEIAATKSGTWIDGNGDQYADAGETVNYTFTVKNTGNVTLHGVTVTDPLITVVGGPVTLAPGETDTSSFTGSYILTQADVDAGHVYNVALATGYPPSGPPVTDEPPNDTPLPQNPALALVKTASPATYDEVGDVVSYSYLITNTGNVTLDGPITVSDDKATVTVPDVDTLAPGESVTGSASYTITQADLDAGSVTNTAQAHAAFGGEPVDSNYDDETVTAEQNPALALVKTASPATYDEVGDVVSYSYLITNTGNVTLDGPITVSDDKATVTVPDVDTLAPGESVTGSASYTITQADLDAGSVTNTAQAHAAFGGEPVDSNYDDETVTAEQNPAISATKSGTFMDDIDGDGYGDVGETIHYTFTVTNTGNVTLHDVTITDPKVDVIGGPITLAPGETDTTTFTGSYTLTQVDIDAGNVHNVALATGYPPSGPPVTDEPPNDTPVPQNPALSINKVTADGAVSGDGLTVLTGESIEWNYTVTNTGNVTLTNVAVTDDQGVSVTAPKTTLLPGESMVANASGTSIEGVYNNLGTVTGTAPQGGNVTASDSSSYTGIDPKIAIDKVTNGVDGAYIHVGDPVTWTYTVTNAGNAPISNVAVVDDQAGVTPTYVSGDADGDGELDLAEAWVYEADGTAVSGDYSNIGTATGATNDSAGHFRTTTDSDGSSYFGSDPSLTIEKVTNDGATSGDGLNVLTGEAISWDYVVTNTGNVSLSGEVTDDHLGTIGSFTDLAPQGSVTLTLTGTAVTGDYDNVGTVASTGPAGEDIEVSDPSDYFGADPQIDIDKQTLGAVGNWGDGVIVIAGTEVKWQYTVTNVGNVPLSNPGVTDNKSGVTPAYVSGDDNGDGILDLSETWVYEASGTAVGGAYDNVGTASGSYTDGAGHTRTDTATDPSDYVGKTRVSILKTVNGKPFSGPELTFQIREGASMTSLGTILETKYANVGNGGLVEFDSLLLPGTYQIVELIPQGYVPSYVWGPYGIEWFRPGYEPGEGGMDPVIWVAVNFTVNTDGSITFQPGSAEQVVQPGDSIDIDNQVGQMPFTIGYWKNHASAKSSNGGQDPVLDQMLYKATQAGQTIKIGTLSLPGGSTPNNAGTSALYAVRLLDKSTVITNKKKASDPAWNCAAQLMGYRLNQPFGAWLDPTADLAASRAQTMLFNVGFNGEKYTAPSKATLAKWTANMNYLAAVLDAYNNGTLTITTLTMPYPGVGY